jgi:hypothetical protein
LNGQGGHSSGQGRGQERGKEGPPGNSLKAQSQGSEPLKKNQCPVCLQEGHWRSECLQLQTRHRETKEKEDFVGLVGIEQASDKGRSGSFLFGPQKPIVHMAVGANLWISC